MTVASAPLITSTLPNFPLVSDFAALDAAIAYLAAWKEAIA